MIPASENEMPSSTPSGMRISFTDAADVSTGAQDIAISKDAVSWTDEAGNVQSAPADTVVVAKGAEGNLSLANSLESAGFKVHAIGDANGVGYIEGAMRGAAEAVRVLTT